MTEADIKYKNLKLHKKTKKKERSKGVALFRGVLDPLLTKFPLCRVVAGR